MDCARVDEELIGFQLAALDGATRAAIEAHLTGCSRCVSSFLALKRAMDAGESAIGPSEMMRMRIRKEAEQQFAVVSHQPSAPERRPTRAKWAIAAAAAAAVLIAPLVYKATRTPPKVNAAVEVAPVKSNETVDTARVTPENLAFL